MPVEGDRSPVPSPNIYVKVESKPFCYLNIKCPWCGKDMVFEGSKQASGEPKQRKE